MLSWKRLIPKTFQLADCLDKLHAGELLRRKLHNTIQELKGNYTTRKNDTPP